MRSEYYPQMIIDLNAIRHNINEIIKICKNKKQIIAVVKDNAYGLGAVEISKVLLSEGIDKFIVARADEAKELVKNRINGKIIILGEISNDEIEWAYLNNVSITVNSIDSLKRIKKANKIPKLHINIDTLMHRMGIPLQKIDLLLNEIKEIKNFVEGIFTHCPNSDNPSTESVMKQFNEFSDIVKIFSQNNINPQIIHFANTGAIANFPHTLMYMCRPGIAIYGCHPDPTNKTRLNLKNVVTIKAPIVRIEEYEKNEPISYCGTYRTSKKTNIATIAIGYAHGLPRILSNKGKVIINDKLYIISGNITMDYIMVDIGCDRDIKTGTHAIICGETNTHKITIDNIAAQSNTIGYEILLSFGNSKIDKIFI